METKPPCQSVVVHHSSLDSPVTRELVHRRTRELALIAGRAAPHVIQADYENAKRELTGETDRDKQNAILDASPEQARVQLAPSLIAQPPTRTFGKHEDETCQSETEQLVDQGMMDAARDRTFRTAKMARLVAQEPSLVAP